MNGKDFFCDNVKCFYHKKTDEDILKSGLKCAVRNTAKMYDYTLIYSTAVKSFKTKIIRRQPFRKDDQIRWFCDECVNAIFNTGFMK